MIPSDLGQLDSNILATAGVSSEQEMSTLIFRLNHFLNKTVDKHALWDKLQTGITTELVMN